jgi:hypothetical protein
VAALRSGQEVGERKTDTLISVVREAAANFGHVSDATWDSAVSCGWSDEQLAEAFGYLGLTVFTAYFLNYARTELDIPAGPPEPDPAAAGEPAATSGSGS